MESQSFLPSKGATEPNRPARSEELFWTLLPQLFVQFDAHSDAELFVLLKAQSETAERPALKKPLHTTVQQCDLSHAVGMETCFPNIFIAVFS
jgi:hypothetical protein